MYSRTPTDTSFYKFLYYTAMFTTSTDNDLPINEFALAKSKHV